MAPTASFRKGDALLCGVVVYCGGGGGSSCCNHLNSSNLANRIGPSNSYKERQQEMTRYEDTE